MRKRERREVIEQIIYDPYGKKFFDLKVIEPRFFLNTCDVPGWIFHKFSQVSIGDVK